MMRINARLDSARTEKLKELQLRTHLSASEIVKRAIDLLHRQQANQYRERLDALLSSDFIGCAEGPTDLSSNYKQRLAESLETKHGVS